MDTKLLQNLLVDVAEGRITPNEAVEKLKTLPYEDVDFAKIDTHRAVRTGRGEVIFGIGKTPEQVAVIMQRLSKTTSPVIATKVGPEYYEAAREAIPAGLSYYDKAKLLVYQEHGRVPPLCHIAVVCAGTADIPIAEEAAVSAEIYGASVDRFYDVGVAGIHRLLDKVEEIRKAKAVVVVAGMEGALPSVVGGLLTRRS